MAKAQYAILRFLKYKSTEISRIEAHVERTKENYVNSQYVDKSLSHLNLHLVKPEQYYRIEAAERIKHAECRVRTDSVWLVEARITASREFFQEKTPQQSRAFFEEALDFFSAHQDPKTFVSAVIHMDEKTPHMHLIFVPLTQDGRLSARDVVGNPRELFQWQEEFWEHMSSIYPELERGGSTDVNKWDNTMEGMWNFQDNFRRNGKNPQYKQEEVYGK